MAKEEYLDLPGYKTPPVIEVVSGVSFDRLDKFKVTHFGRFWEKLKKDFPITDHVVPLDISHPSSQDPVTGLPLPRVWFINESDDQLVQVQVNKFFYNWRKMKEKHFYPSFSWIKEQFNKNFELFLKFLEEENIKISEFQQCELTYMNQIPKGNGWESIEDIQKIFPDLSLRINEDRFLKSPTEFLTQMKYVLPEDNGYLNIKFQHAHRKIDKVPLLILEISARGLGGDKSLATINSWFELAHEWIVKGFEDLTSLEIQKTIWGKYDRRKK